jgi:hypothetical protein
MKRESQYFILLYFFSLNVGTQCACVVSILGGKENNVQAQAVNDGIVYLWQFLYSGAGIGYGVMSNKKKKNWIK